MENKKLKIGDIVQLQWDVFLRQPGTIGIVVNIYQTKTGLEYYKVVWNGRKKAPVPKYLTANELIILEV